MIFLLFLSRQPLVVRKPPTGIPGHRGRSDCQSARRLLRCLLTMMIENFLRNLGLNESEIRVYFYLLTHGESIVSMVAKRLEMKRVTCYSTLEALEKKGMITSFTKNNVAHFDAVEPDDIIELCSQRVNEMQRLQRKASELKSEFHKLREKGKMPKLEIRGKIKYYQGLEAVTDHLIGKRERAALFRPQHLPQ
jgi:predicted transcriptional regulator